jgi:hypothetical protein
MRAFEKAPPESPARTVKKVTSSAVATSANRLLARFTVTHASAPRLQTANRPRTM